MNDDGKEKLENIYEAMIRSSVWRPGTIDEEPEVTLVNWTIVEATFDENPDKISRHLIGTNTRNGYKGEGRVSSAIQDFDQEKMVGKTRSGRVYKLIGPPGYSNDGSWVWDTWSRHNRVSRTMDVTSEYWLDMPDSEERGEKLV